MYLCGKQVLSLIKSLDVHVANENGLLPAEITRNLLVDVPLALPNLGLLSLVFINGYDASIF